MDSNCTYKNLLVRDGTSQISRFVKALDPTYISIDDRDRKDLILFAKKFSKLISYYDIDNKLEGSWDEFFSEKTNSNDPHFALYLAFIYLFGYAQKDLNNLSKRHLDYYYKQVLGLYEKSASPDSVHVLFTLAKNIDSYLIKKGTLLSAGKDKSGNELKYQLDKDLVVNKAIIAELKSVFVDLEDNSDGIKYIYASPIANSSDGLGKEIEGDEPKWSAFGSKQPTDKNSERSMSDAEIGFAITSPILYMEEGTRKVDISLIFKESIADNTKTSDDTKIKDNEKKDFSIYFSSGEKWIGPYYVDATIFSEKVLILNVEIGSEEPAIKPFDDKSNPGSFDNQYPLIKILINKKAENYKHSILRSLHIDAISVNVNVTGVKNLVLQSDKANINPNKPFQPFGSTPSIGSGLYIGSYEAFSKSLDTLDINYEWFEIPSDLNKHYSVYTNALKAAYLKEYPSGTDFPILNNSSFKAKVQVLDKKGWIDADIKIENNPEASKFDLFNSSNACTKVKLNISSISNIEGSKRKIPLKKFTEFTNNSTSGFIKLELTNPNLYKFNAFGHKWYPALYTEQIIKKIDTDTTELPNEAYTPLIKEISIDYSSSELIDLTTNLKDDFNKRTSKFYHVGPFGEAERHLYNYKDSIFIPLLPLYDGEGTFYMGIKGLSPPENLSILFQVAEGSADLSINKEIKITWSYLADNNWIEFNQNDILSDNTNSLTKSGIISFAISKNANLNNTILNPNYHWIRGFIEEDTIGVGCLISVNTQAVTATLSNKHNDPDHLNSALPGNSISKLEKHDSSIKSVSQPNASFGGKIAESSKELYTRVSERLRHKNRAINIWDYERIVLEKFPSVYKVKCLNHTSLNSEYAPGNVSLIVISNLNNQNAVNKLEPATSVSTLIDIKKHVKTLCSEFINLEVKNPDFEKIQLDFRVKFHANYDAGYYLGVLDKEIKEYLAPWAYQSSVDVVFQGRIHKSVLLNFIEKRPYVDFVACFKMHHYINKTTVLKDVNEAIVKNSAAILTSFENHKIKIIEGEECNCKEEDPTMIILEGIGAMSVEIDFIIANNTSI